MWINYCIEFHALVNALPLVPILKQGSTSLSSFHVLKFLAIASNLTDSSLSHLPIPWHCFNSILFHQVIKQLITTDLIGLLVSGLLSRPSAYPLPGTCNAVSEKRNLTSESGMRTPITLMQNKLIKHGHTPFKIILFLCMSLRVYHVYAGTHRDQKRVSNLQGLELPAVLKCLKGGWEPSLCPVEE